MFSGSIDWGTLAQQWIQMKDGSSATMPEVPPAPNISGIQHDVKVPNTSRVTSIENRKYTFEEQGEADMELAEDEDHIDKTSKTVNSVVPPPQAPLPLPVGEGSVVMQPPWFIQQSQAPPIVVPGVPGPLPPTGSQWNVWPPRVTVPPPNLAAPTANPTAHIPSLLKINIPNPNTLKPTPDIEPTSIVTNTAAEAAKRKILPAWIREGLEKMEREKQRQLERDQQQEYSKNESLDTKIQFDVKDVVLPNEYTVKKNTITALESDSSGNEGEDDGNVIKSDPSAGRVTSVATVLQSENDNSNIDGQQISGNSYEQKLHDLMIIVRETLTELLLEVTNEEIANIAQETLKSRKSKASSAEVIRKSDLYTITGKLGLAAYVDSSSDESNGSDIEPSSDKDDKANDSEEEIQTTIRMKRRAFVKISEEIEERIAVAAAHEEQKLKYYTQLEENLKGDHYGSKPKVPNTHGYGNKRRESDDRAHSTATGDNTVGKHTSASSGGKTNERDFGETTSVSKLHHPNGKRHRERLARKERTTRFSDNKEPKTVSAVATSNANFMPQLKFPTKSTNADITPTKSTYLLPTTSASAGASLNHVLNAAEAALEKAIKIKTSSSMKSQRKSHRSHRRSRSCTRSSADDDESSSSSSSNSESSSSSSSRNSKYSRNSRNSSLRHKSRALSRSRQRKTSSSSSYRRNERERYKDDRKRRHQRHHPSSDSDNDAKHDGYRKRSRYSRRSKTRSHSRSPYPTSKTSYSSSRRRH